MPFPSTAGRRAPVARGFVAAALVAVAPLASRAEARELGPTPAPPPSFGFNLDPLRSGPAFARATAELPFLRVRTEALPVHIALRAEAAGAWTSKLPPAVLGNALLRLETPYAQPYVGLGGGYGWRDLGSSLKAVPLMNALAGVRVPVAGRWSARLEVSGAPVVESYAASLGAEWSL